MSAIQPSSQFTGSLQGQFRSGGSSTQDSALDKRLLIEQFQSRFSDLVLKESGRIAAAEAPDRALEQFACSLLGGVFDPPVRNADQFRSVRDVIRRQFARNQTGGIADATQQTERQVIDYALNLTSERLLGSPLQKAAALAHLNRAEPKMRKGELIETLGRQLRVASAPILAELTLLTGSLKAVTTIAPEINDEERRAFQQAIDALGNDLRSAATVSGLINARKLGAGDRTVYGNPEHLSAALTDRYTELRDDLGYLGVTLRGEN